MPSRFTTTACAITLGALLTACDQASPSMPEGDPVVDAGPDATVDASPPDAIVDPEPEIDPGPGLLFAARLPDEAGARTLVVVDPVTGALERWGAPLPLEPHQHLLEVMYDAALSRAVVRYGWEPTPPTDRRNNFAYAGYWAGTRDGEWRRLVHAQTAVSAMVEPGLGRISYLAVDQLDPEICQRHALVTFDGELLFQDADDAGRCTLADRLWGFGPDGAYTLYARGDDLMFVPAGVHPSEGRWLHSTTRPPAGPDRPVALFENSVVLSVDTGPGYFDLDGQPLAEQALPYLYFGPDSTAFFSGGDLWRLRDGAIEQVYDDRDDTLERSDGALEPLPGAIDAAGHLQRIWMSFDPAGAWVGAVASVRYTSSIDAQDPAPEVDVGVLEFWRPDGDGGVARDRLIDVLRPHTARFDRSGRLALWADACGVMRADLATGETARFDFAGVEVLDLPTGEPGWWGGLARGNGRSARDAAGWPVVNARDPALSPACE